jgi:hypothetical protein
VEHGVNTLSAGDGIDTVPDAGGEGAVEDGPVGAEDAEGGAAVHREADLEARVISLEGLEVF